MTAIDAPKHAIPSLMPQLAGLQPPRHTGFFTWLRIEVEQSRGIGAEDVALGPPLEKGQVVGRAWQVEVQYG